jgi:hypothetical protein
MVTKEDWEKSLVHVCKDCQATISALNRTGLCTDCTEMAMDLDPDPTTLCECCDREVPGRDWDDLYGCCGDCSWCQSLGHCMNDDLETECCHKLGHCR